MKMSILCLLALGVFTYGFAAYTRPEEPAGRVLHRVLRVYCPELARPELEGNEFSPRPTLRGLEVVPATATPYSPEELSEIYPTH